MNIRNKRELIIILSILGGLLASVTLLIFRSYMYFPLSSQDLNISEKHCLSGGIDIKVSVENFVSSEINYDNLKFNVIDKGRETSNFILSNIPPNHINPYHLGDCGVYYLYFEGIDYNNFKPLDGYKMIIKYKDYGNMPSKDILVVWKQENNTFINEFSDIFSINPQETYISLVKSYLGSEDYSLVIKDIDTKEDVYVLLLNDLFVEYPDYVGDIEFVGWSDDGRYFWFRIFDQADTLAFVRIDTTQDIYEVYDVPYGVMGGDPLNTENGWVTYDNGAPWTGVSELDSQYQKEWLEKGKLVNFKLYNVYTKEEILLEQFTDPLWYPQQTWLDEETLQYKIPSGEIREYKL